MYHCLSRSNFPRLFIDESNQDLQILIFADSGGRSILIKFRFLDLENPSN